MHVTWLIEDSQSCNANVPFTKALDDVRTKFVCADTKDVPAIVRNNTSNRICFILGPFKQRSDFGEMLFDKSLLLVLSHFISLPNFNL